METKLLGTTEKELKEAAQILAKGGLVAFPTETVYGLGADAFDPSAANKAYAAKGRPSDNPLIVHIAKIQDLYKVAKVVPERALKLAEVFWPGPLTMVLPKVDKLPKETTGGLDTVAIRLPDDPATLKFIELSGTAVSGPSANISGRPSPTSWEHVKTDLDGKIDAIICGNPCRVGIESTVLDLTESVPCILRPGFITPEMIEEVLGCEVSYDKTLFAKPSEDPNYKPKAPGQKYKHYAPKAQMAIYKTEEALNKRLAQEKAAGKKVGFILNPESRTFFAKLREFDAQDFDIILVKALPEGSSLNFSLMNRVLKSAGYNVVEN